LLTSREISGFAGAGLMLAVAMWFWLTDINARLDGVQLVGTYSGNFERFRTNSKFGGEHVSARLIVNFVTPDGLERTAALEDLTDLDALPVAGTEMDILWLPDQPDTVRSAEALSGPIGKNAGWLAGIAAFIFFAQLSDVISRRRRSG
jgi:hypothetical protein